MKLFSMQFAKVLRVDTIVCAVMLVFSLSGCSLFDDSDGKLQQIGRHENNVGHGVEELHGRHDRRVDLHPAGHHPPDDIAHVAGIDKLKALRIVGIYRLDICAHRRCRYFVAPQG